MKESIRGILFDGVVLAAGRSTRMGRDKALLPAPEGEGAMWERQRDLLRAAGAAEIFLSARPEQRWARDAVSVGRRGEGERGKFAAMLYDSMPGCGPMMGITAALERSARTHVAVLAIDLPRITSAWFLRLCGECARGVGAVGRRRDAGNFFEPLAAIYPREMMYFAWEALARGEYSLQTLIGRAVAEGLVRVCEIADADARWFENWNEPGAVDESESRRL